MDIIISEIKVTNEEKIKEFDIIHNKITYFLEHRFSHLNKKSKIKEKVNINLEINTNTEINMDLVKRVYIKLFKEPTDGIFDINKLKVIEKHLKRNNLI